MCVLWAAILLTFSGCMSLPRSRDPGNMELITVMGVDVTSAGRTRITFLGSGEQPQIVAEEAEAPCSAAQKALLRGKKQLFPGNMEYVLIGRTAAERGIAQILDYLLRDNDIRPVIRLCLVEGQAEALLTGYSDSASLADRLTDLIRIGKEQSELFSLTLAQAAAAWYGDEPIVMPMLSLSDGDAAPAGGAVLWKGRLAGVMNSSQTRGYMLLTGASGGHPLEIRGENGVEVYQIRDASVDMKPVIENGVVKSLSLTLRFELSLTQSNMTMQLSRSRTRTAAQTREEACVRSALRFSRDLGLEIFGFGEKVQAFHLSAWEGTEQWQLIWHELPLALKTEVKFDRTFELWGEN